MIELLAFFLVWSVLGGWVWGIHEWRKSFDLDLLTLVFILGLGTLFGPLIPLTWLFCRLTAGRKPRVILRAYKRPK